MSNAEDLLETLIKALKDSNVDAEELRFMTLFPDHMRKIQDLTEEFVKAHVEGPHHLEIYMRAIIGVVAHVQAALVVNSGTESIQEFAQLVAHKSEDEYLLELGHMLRDFTDSWLTVFLQGAREHFGEEVFKAYQNQVKDTIRNAKSEMLKSKEGDSPFKDSFIPSFAKQ
ncbi:TPA: hypothetical protein ACGHB6_002693 [Acinetobacter baumannii]|uniref:hypothetical protein n=1 Tax=Acinetobacter baumannii TaxID=470 RepID=UPI00338FCE44